MKELMIAGALELGYIVWEKGRNLAWLESWSWVIFYNLHARFKILELGYIFYRRKKGTYDCQSLVAGLYSTAERKELGAGLDSMKERTKLDIWPKAWSWVYYKGERKELSMARVLELSYILWEKGRNLNQMLEAGVFALYVRRKELGNRP